MNSFCDLNKTAITKINKKYVKFIKKNQNKDDILVDDI